MSSNDHKRGFVEELWLFAAEFHASTSSIADCCCYFLKRRYVVWLEINIFQMPKVCILFHALSIAISRSLPAINQNDKHYFLAGQLLGIIESPEDIVRFFLAQAPDEGIGCYAGWKTAKSSSERLGFWTLKGSFAEPKTCLAVAWMS